MDNLKSSATKINCSDESPTVSVASIVDSIIAEFEVSLGSADRVKFACKKLLKKINCPPTFNDMKHIGRMVPLIGKRKGPIVEALFDTLEKISLSIKNPWHLLKGLSTVKEIRLIKRSLELVLYHAESGSLSVDLHVAAFFAEQIEREGCHFKEYELLEIIKKILCHLSINLQPDQPDPIAGLYLQEDNISLRLLAARIMDLPGEPASENFSRHILGSAAYEFLEPYLIFTRATYLDLCYLVPVPGESPPCLESLQRVEASIGEKRLKEVIAVLGWEGLNFSLEVHNYISVSIDGSFPIICLSEEASIFRIFEKVQFVGEEYLFIGHGGIQDKYKDPAGKGNLMSRFRSYNLAHAEFLNAILSPAPLSCQKIPSILELMDVIVSEFLELFSTLSEECSILPGLYNGLRDKILQQLKNESGESQISAGMARLIQTFEDPQYLEEVRTLHGLKRYLHQRGLALITRLVGSGAATSRYVNLVLASKKRVLKVFKCISYVDFDPGEEFVGEGHIPFPVEFAINSFIYQILRKHEKLPHIKIFCYGNEAHYYISFMNHPAFLRIDFSPPQMGGMIDLEYYGVSKYELDLHPNISLDAIKKFFDRLGFDFQAKETRVHARYDKEEATNIDEIFDKAEAILRLIPYFMEIDWVIGSLELSPASRKIVAEAWSEFFFHWGTLPIDRFLTKDRQGILFSTAPGPIIDQEQVWSGEEPYRDEISRPMPSDLFNRLKPFLSKVGLDEIHSYEYSVSCPAGQIELEKQILRPLRRALKRGEIEFKHHGFRPAQRTIFKLKHEAERFAEILVSDKQTIHASAVLGRFIAQFERNLRFNYTGSLNGYDVQKAALMLRGETLGIYVLRDGRGAILLAFFTWGEKLHLRRKGKSVPWSSNECLDEKTLARILRVSNYITPGMWPTSEIDHGEVERIKGILNVSNPLKRSRPLTYEKIVPGLRASPGRSTGRVILGTEKRQPKDFKGSLLVSPTVVPEDGPYLFHAEGVVSTGGGILSHAGLISLQLKKPALVISGQWHRESNGALFLLCTTSHFQQKKKLVKGYHVSFLSGVQIREHRIQEGDLAVLDADEGELRILGQKRDAIAFHETLRKLFDVSGLMSATVDGKEILILRGQRLRCLHQIEGLVSRLSDQVLARHVVHEILLSDCLSSGGGDSSEKARIMALLFDNPEVGKSAFDYHIEVVNSFRLRYLSFLKEIQRQISFINLPHEILLPRLRLIQLRQTIESLSENLHDLGFKKISADNSAESNIDQHIRTRLEELKGEIVKRMESTPDSLEGNSVLRHLISQANCLESLLGTPFQYLNYIDSYRNRIDLMVSVNRKKAESRLVLGPGDGGYELSPFIGWKAANLAEVGRLAGQALVPPWFAVTDYAFQEILDSPISEKDGMTADFCGKSMRIAIDDILLRKDIDSFEKSGLIRDLWKRIVLPQELIEEILGAYHGLLRRTAGAKDLRMDGSDPYVAVRSSSHGEDSEINARAGEFDTFLFVKGEKSLFENLKMAWSGLWTERAIHFRNILGLNREKPGGGIIVQLNARSRVSGVLQTANINIGDVNEIVINAGLGLGEGIVSGRVPCDQIFVAKQEILKDRPLQFRYITNDKNVQSVFNSSAGIGTVIKETPYYQHLRPALEYVELYELVKVSLSLERAYGYPLDIEFGIENNRLWILQVRPIVRFLSTIKETLQYFPVKNLRVHDQ